MCINGPICLRFGAQIYAQTALRRSTGDSFYIFKNLWLNEHHSTDCSPSFFLDNDTMSNLMWSQSEDSPLGSTAASSLRLSTGVTVEFNTKLTVKLRYLGCRVLTALFRPPTLLTLWAVDEWTITGQLHWALGSSGFRTPPPAGCLVLTQAVFEVPPGRRPHSASRGRGGKKV